MYTTPNTMKGTDLRRASGEELLMLAVFGTPSLKPKIDDELDRRALAATGRGMEFASYMSPVHSGHAA